MAAAQQHWLQATLVTLGTTGGQQHVQHVTLGTTEQTTRASPSLVLVDSGGIAQLLLLLTGRRCWSTCKQRAECG